MVHAFDEANAARGPFIPSVQGFTPTQSASMLPAQGSGTAAAAARLVCAGLLLLAAAAAASPQTPFQLAPFSAIHLCQPFSVHISPAVPAIQQASGSQQEGSPYTLTIDAADPQARGRKPAAAKGSPLQLQAPPNQAQPPPPPAPAPAPVCRWRRRCTLLWRAAC